MSKKFTRNEDKIIKQIYDYVEATYAQHYRSKQGTDVIDDWEDARIDKENFQGNILKYAKRFGKKEGYNPKDVFKIIHYSILLLNALQREELEAQQDLGESFEV